MTGFAGWGGVGVLLGERSCSDGWQTVVYRESAYTRRTREEVEGWLGLRGTSYTDGIPWTARSIRFARSAMRPRSARLRWRFRRKAKSGTFVRGGRLSGGWGSGRGRLARQRSLTKVCAGARGSCADGGSWIGGEGGEGRLVAPPAAALRPSAER